MVIGLCDVSSPKGLFGFFGREWICKGFAIHLHKMLEEALAIEESQGELGLQNWYACLSEQQCAQLQAEMESFAKNLSALPEIIAPIVNEISTALNHWYEVLPDTIKQVIEKPNNIT